MEKSEIEVGDRVSHSGELGCLLAIFDSRVCVVDFDSGVMRTVDCSELVLVAKDTSIDGSSDGD